MPVMTYDNLPAATRQAIAARVGVVTGFRSASHGDHAHVAGELLTAAGSLFIKAAPTADRESLYVRHEVAVNAYVSPLGPPLLWGVEAGGWYVAAWKHLEMRHPVYKPGSPDLSAVAGLMLDLGTMKCPDAINWRVESRYEEIIGADVRVMAGATILHTDLNPANLLIGEDAAVAVDWAFCSRGAAWLECAYLMPWLIQGGHTPAEAQAWLSDTFAVWRDVQSNHVDIFVGTLAHLWTRRAIPEAPKWIHDYSAAVREWHRLRL